MAGTIATPEERTVVLQRDALGRGEMAPPYLIVVDGPHHGARFPLAEGDQVIGRLPESPIYLDDQSVSRRHATVIRSDTTLQVRDEGSKNGTAVNGVQTRDTITIGHGDVLTVGIYALRVIARAVPAEEELAPVAFGRGMVSESVAAEIGADTATMQEPDPTIDDDAADGEAAAEAADDEVPPKQRIPWLRRLVLVSVFAGGMAGAVFAGIWAYGTYFAPPPEAPKKMITRTIPPEPTVPLTGEEAQQSMLPVEVPVFLDFLANPMPAKVLFLGKDYGLTPVQANVILKVDEQFTAEGQFVIPEFKETLTERVTFVVNREQSLIPVYFRAPIGIFKLEKLPREVEVQIQGNFANDPNTPHTTILSHVTYGKPVYFPYGRYIIEIRRAKGVGIDGKFVNDIRYRREVLLSADTPAFALNVTDAELEQYPVDITSTPDGAELFLDTKPLGKTPYSGQFPMGEHLLVLRKDGYLEEAKQVKNDINQPMKFELTLKTTAAGELLVQGRQMILQGHFTKAVDVLSQVFQKQPTPVESAQAQYWLGSAFIGQSDWDRARSYFQQAQAHADYRLKAKLGLARIAMAQQQPRDALLAVVEVLLKTSEGSVYDEALAVLRDLSPLKSVMYIRTEPPGASVQINGETMKTQTPLLIPDLGPGNYRVRVDQPNFQPQEVNVNLSVHEFNPVLIKLLPVK